jgi:hypothetical protein
VGGCAKGLDGPLGASGKLATTAVPGVDPGGCDAVADSGVGKAVDNDLSPRAS